MTAARTLRSPLRAATFETLVGLLAVAGLRIGEALRLDRDDVDLTAGVLTIRLSKFGKSREVPIHASTADALANYSRRRDRLCQPADQAFFISTTGRRLLYCNAPSPGSSWSARPACCHVLRATDRDPTIMPTSALCRPRIRSAGLLGELLGGRSA